MENLKLDMFHPQKAELQKAAQEFKDLKIDWIDDKSWYKLVHEAEMKLRKMRTWISKTRVDYTRQFDEAKRQAMSLEKELLWIIEPVEQELKAKKKQIDEEKERIKQEELEKARKHLQDRVWQLLEVEYSHSDLHELSQMSAEDFQELLDEKSHIFLENKTKQEEKEKERLRQEERNAVLSWIFSAESIEQLNEIKKKIEDNNLWFEEYEKDFNSKRDMIEKQEKLDAQQKKIDEEKAKIQAEKDEEKRKEDLKKAEEEWRKKAEEDAKKRKLATDAEIEELSKISDLWAMKEKKILHTSCSPHVYDKERLLDWIRARIEELQKIEDQKELEKEKKFQTFLKKHEWKYDEIVHKDWKTILYKVVAEFTK